jgi:hypothetical protein
MTTLDGPSRTFQQALEEARRSDRGAGADSESGHMSKLRVRTAVEIGRAQGGGGDARWGLAMTWTNEPEAMTSAPTAGQPCEPARLDTDIAEAIARELGVGAGLTEGQLTRRWRAFFGAITLTVSRFMRGSGPTSALRSPTRSMIRRGAT